MNGDYQLRDQIRNLRKAIILEREAKVPVSTAWSNELNVQPPQELRVRKTLITKQDGIIKTLDFSPKGEVMTLAAGATSNGSIVLWDSGLRERKIYVQLPNAWMMTATIDHTYGEVVGTGGLDNIFYVYRVDDTAQAIIDRPELELRGHDANFNDAQFFDEKRVLSASGDKTLKVWDLQRRAAIETLIGHTADVFSCAVSPTDPDVVLSGAGDCTARVWDRRNIGNGGQQRDANVFTFDVGCRDVNGVEFFPDGRAFATALNTADVHLYDIRSSCRLLAFSDLREQSDSAEQVAFSCSGRLLFVRYKNDGVKVFDLTQPVAKEVESNAQRVASITADRRSTRPDPRIKGAFSTLSFSEIEKPEYLSVSPSGAVLGVGIAKASSQDTIAKIFWPGGR